MSAIVFWLVTLCTSAALITISEKCINTENGGNKFGYPLTVPQCITTEKIKVYIFNTVRTSDLIILSHNTLK
jgi:hypothetical protein